MSRDVLLTGTSIVEAPFRSLRAGALEAEFDSGALRWIRWKGVEVLRSIAFLVRTPGWGTAAPDISGLEIEERPERFTVSFEAHYGAPGVGLRVAVRLKGVAAGRLTAEATIDAEAPFETNRTGFVVLHPLDGFAGTPVHVDHASAPSRDLVIPAQISPGQPVMDIRAVTHRPVPRLTVETRFDGDIFEMEDHRNWSDASFKTYSRPIGLPYPYTLAPGAPIAQSVTVSILDDGTVAAPAPAIPLPALSGRRLPDYALPLDRLADVTAALAHSDALRALAPGWLLLRFDATREAADAGLAPLAALLRSTSARLEVQAILASESDAAAADEIAHLATRFAGAGVDVGRIGAFAKIDEQSFQPGEPRPPHPSEAAIAAALAASFPDATQIGGSPAFFTEFNRKPPTPSLWRGLTFNTAPTVHAADDASVIETLQSLLHILASATALANGLPLLIGPVGIGARINPYGAAPSLNAPEAREGMAARDPRQRGLFAAAWTVGYLASIARYDVARFAFGAPVGPFGLLSTRQDHARPFWDDRPEGALYPLYHVARTIAAAAGSSLVEADSEGGVARIVWERDGHRKALLANLTPRQVAVPSQRLEKPRVSVLDAGSLEAFSADAGASIPQRRELPAVLDAYAVMFLAEERRDA
ncbi:MAG TPA: hypothetical protein VNX29_18610 [Kaistia sp.]|nr:hypothetical protein [Kaistia sp.]